MVYRESTLFVPLNSDTRTSAAGDCRRSARRQSSVSFLGEQGGLRVEGAYRKGLPLLAATLFTGCFSQTGDGVLAAVRPARRLQSEYSHLLRYRVRRTRNGSCPRLVR